MASISTDANGRRRILFVAPNGNRSTIRLGQCGETRALNVKNHVEELVYAKRTSSSAKGSTADWVSGLSKQMRKILERAELVSPQARPAEQTTDICPTVQQWFERYIAGRKTAKPATIIKLNQIMKKVVSFFGPDLPLDKVNTGMAIDFMMDMKDKGMSEGSTRRLCGMAKQVFTRAVKSKIIAENPFEDEEIKCANFADRSRFHFVTQADAQAILEKCPDDEWKLIFALCRYGALRCPSEIHSLTWSDIKWDIGRFVVHSVKTERYEGKGTRIVPIFPELAPLFQKCFDDAEDGAQYVITKHRDSNRMLRKQYEKVLADAGIKPYAKLFVNLRASRAIELNETFPGHVVAEWLGHSEQVEQRHYLRATDDHYLKATQILTQIPTQQVDAPSGNTLPSQEIEKTKIALVSQFKGFPKHSKQFQTSKNNLMGVTGLGPVTSCL